MWRVIAALGLVWAAAASAADPVEILPPVALAAEPSKSAPATNGIEVARSDADKPVKPVFELRGRFEADALGVYQSLANRLTVGNLQSATGFRRARLGAQGTFGEHFRWITEFDFADGDVRFADVFAGLGGLPVPGELQIGHFREPFGLEGQMSSNSFPFIERSPANSLDPGRNWGVGLFAHTPAETATL